MTMNYRTPLHLAAKRGHTTCVERLLFAPGIDANTKDEVSWYRYSCGIPPIQSGGGGAGGGGCGIPPTLARGRGKLLFVHGVQGLTAPHQFCYHLSPPPPLIYYDGTTYMCTL